MDWLSTIVEDPRTERVIMSLIIVNAVILGLETSKTVMASFGPLLELLDHLILAVFVVEIAARILVHRVAFFRDPWSVFDFLVVGIALVPATETFTVLRALRILRVLRLITAVPTLKRVVAGLLAALPGMGSIVLLIGLIYYVFGVMATKLFGETNPDLFGTLGERAVHAVHGDDARGLGRRRHQAGDGASSLCLAVLLHLHRRDHVHGAEPVHRRGGQCHAGGSGESRCSRTRGRARDDPGGSRADPRRDQEPACGSGGAAGRDRTSGQQRPAAEALGPITS